MVKQLLGLALATCILTTNAHAHYNDQHFDARYDFDNVIDEEKFSLVKNELQRIRKVLTQIRDTQDPGAISNGLSLLKTVLKESVYIGSSVALGGGCIALGTSLIIGPDTVGAILRNPMGQGAALFVLPLMAISTLTTYVFLKLIFGKLLASSTDDCNIQNSLDTINQLITKLDYELKKIDRISKQVKRIS